MNKRLNKIRKRRISEHALHILQTLHLQKAPSPNEKPKSPRSPKLFAPSPKLQELFDKYDGESDSDNSSSSSIDYNALALDFEDGDFYKSLRHMWSMYVMNGDTSRGSMDEDNDSIELDVDYDAVLRFDDDQSRPNLDSIFLDCDKNMDSVRRYSEGSWEKDKLSTTSSVRLALSTPPGSLHRELQQSEPSHQETICNNESMQVTRL